MQKIDKIVKNETKYIALWVLILSVLMQAVFLVIGRWDYTVLLGNLLTGITGVLNFLLMGIAVQQALEKEEKEAKQHMKASSAMRTCALFVITVIGVIAPIFHIWAVIIPLFFPRIAIALRPLWDKKKSGKEDSNHAG